MGAASLRRCPAAALHDSTRRPLASRAAAVRKDLGSFRRTGECFIATAAMERFFCEPNRGVTIWFVLQFCRELVLVGQLGLEGDPGRSPSLTSAHIRVTGVVRPVYSSLFIFPPFKAVEVSLRCSFFFFFNVGLKK